MIDDTSTPTPLLNQATFYRLPRALLEPRPVGPTVHLGLAQTKWLLHWFAWPWLYFDMRFKSPLSRQNHTSSLSDTETHPDLVMICSRCYMFLFQTCLILLLPKPRYNGTLETHLRMGKGSIQWEINRIPWGRRRKIETSHECTSS